MKVLITGIYGFVGTNLVEGLCEDNLIYGLDIIQKEHKGVQHTYSWEDLDNKTIPEVDAIIHLAGKAHDTKNKADSKVYFDINTGLTQKMYDYFLQSNAKKFIFFSSVKAAADSVEGEILTENVKPKPIGPYGESKIRAEEYILENIHMLGDKTYIILRPCMIHGPGNKGNLNLLYNVVSKGIPWPLGKYDNKRSFLSINNLKYAIDSLLKKEIESGIYQIGDDEPISMNELIQTICTSLGKKPRIWYVPKWIIGPTAKIGGLFRLPLNSERLRKLTENYVVSNEKIKKQLEVNSFPVSSKEGLESTVNSFKNNNK